MAAFRDLRDDDRWTNDEAMVFGKVKFPELDKSQAEILGIAGEEGGKIQFQSLETGRRVLILLTTSDDDPKTGSRVR